MPTVIELQNDQLALPVRRRPALRRTLVAVVVLALLAAGFVLVTHRFSHADRSMFTADGITRVVIAHDAGSVTLVPSSSTGRVDVRTQRHWSFGKPGAVGHVDDGVLTITGGCPAPGIGNCRIDQTVSVPSGVTLQVRVDSGDVRASGLVLKAIDVDVKSGDLALDRVGAPRAAMSTDSGDVSATLLAVPAELTATSGAGNVTLTVPRQAYRIDADARAGQVRVGVEEDANSPAMITARTRSGNVTIQP